MSASVRPQASKPILMTSMESFIGQRFFSTVVDLCFFAIIALFGVRKVIGEVLIGTLLSSYAAYRFGVASGKQQAVTALNASGALSQGGGSGPVSGGVGGAGSGGSGATGVGASAAEESHLHTDAVQHCLSQLAQGR